MNLQPIQVDIFFPSIYYVKINLEFTSNRKHRLKMFKSNGTYIQGTFVGARQGHSKAVKGLVGSAVLLAVEAFDRRPQLSEEQL